MDERNGGGCLVVGVMKRGAGRWMSRLLLCWSFVLLCFAGGAIGRGEAKSIVYIPADDRPVSLGYVVDTLQAAGCQLIVPPAELLAGRGRTGKPEALWQWLAEQAPAADAFVLSGDTLIYGGLVDSRTHELPGFILEGRLQRFAGLRLMNARAPVYVFATLMRSPKMSVGGMEPVYYEKYGGALFQLTALQDEAELRGLSEKEQSRLQSLEASLPQEYLSDWLERRAKNYQIDTGLLALLKQKQLDYLLLGRDDTSPFSRSHQEFRSLQPLVRDLPAGTFASFPGADQLGMVLLTRASNRLAGKRPAVYVRYAAGAGPDTVASYEDQPLGLTVVDHIKAAGGRVAATAQQADLVLYLNTPLTGKTEEADVFTNLPVREERTEKLAQQMAEDIRAGRPVAMADVAYANGADNSLLQAMFKQGLLDKLAAYSGWNTASNTLGYALGQGLLARNMDDKERKRLLAVRYLEDWAYQANIRPEVCWEVVYLNQGRTEYLSWLNPEAAARTNEKLQRFARRFLWIDPAAIRVAYPWDRMFDLAVVVAP